MRAVSRLSTVSGSSSSGSVLRGEHELAHEQRVAAGALGERSDRLDGESELRGDGDRELLGGSAGDRRQFDPRRVLGGRCDRLRPGSGGDADDPGALAGSVTRWVSRNRDESSSQWASSITSSVGIIRIRSRNVWTAQWSLSRLAAASSVEASGVASTIASNGIASSGSQGTRSGIALATNASRAAPASSGGRLGVIPTSWRSSGWKAANGWVDE